MLQNAALEAHSGVDVQLDLVPVRIEDVHALRKGPLRLVEDGTRCQKTCSRQVGARGTSPRRRARRFQVACGR
jgi:hypothetical protein